MSFGNLGKSLSSLSSSISSLSGGNKKDRQVSWHADELLFYYKDLSVYRRRIIEDLKTEQNETIKRENQLRNFARQIKNSAVEVLEDRSTLRSVQSEFYESESVFTDDTLADRFTNQFNI